MKKYDNYEGITVTKREDGLYNVSTEEAGFIGTVMECQLEKAAQILKGDKWGRNFYNKLNR